VKRDKAHSKKNKSARKTKGDESDTSSQSSKRQRNPEKAKERAKDKKRKERLKKKAAKEAAFALLAEGGVLSGVALAKLKRVLDGGDDGDSSGSSSSSVSTQSTKSIKKKAKSISDGESINTESVRSELSDDLPTVSLMSRRSKSSGGKGAGGGGGGDHNSDEDPEEAMSRKLAKTHINTLIKAEAGKERAAAIRMKEDYLSGRLETQAEVFKRIDEIIESESARHGPTGVTLHNTNIKETLKMHVFDLQDLTGLNVFEVGQMFYDRLLKYHACMTQFPPKFLELITVSDYPLTRMAEKLSDQEESFMDQEREQNEIVSETLIIPIKEDVIYMMKEDVNEKYHEMFEALKARKKAGEIDSDKYKRRRDRMLTDYEKQLNSTDKQGTTEYMHQKAEYRQK
jgi:hypothetical protein